LLSSADTSLPKIHEIAELEKTNGGHLDLLVIAKVVACGVNVEVCNR
jgi:hypothetical protein